MIRRLLVVLLVTVAACSSTPLDTTDTIDCGTGGQSCGGVCVHVDSDNRNCGHCGVLCALNETCIEGNCAPACGGGTSRCGDACVDLGVDRTNCGACGAACTAGQVCANGACAVTCLAGAARCELVPGQAYCANLETDDRNCGACGHACAGQATCVAGACLPPCATGQARCGVDCVDPKTSWKDCGQCGNTCGSAHQCRDHQCADTGNVVFITSTLSDGNRGGLKGADATCQSLAEAARLGGTFMAWLSDDKSSPSTRFVHSTSRYALVDGTLIAANWNDLTDGYLAHAIDEDETGAPGPQTCLGECDLWAHTATMPSGVAWSPTYMCANWTSNKTSDARMVGRGSAIDSRWSLGSWGGGCDWKVALYCFQQ